MIDDLVFTPVVSIPTEYLVSVPLQVLLDLLPVPHAAQDDLLQVSQDAQACGQVLRVALPLALDRRGHWLDEVQDPRSGILAGHREMPVTARGTPGLRERVGMIGIVVGFSVGLMPRDRTLLDRRQSSSVHRNRSEG